MRSAALILATLGLVDMGYVSAYGREQTDRVVTPNLSAAAENGAVVPVRWYRPYYGGYYATPYRSYYSPYSSYYSPYSSYYSPYSSYYTPYNSYYTPYGYGSYYYSYPSPYYTSPYYYGY